MAHRVCPWWLGYFLVCPLRRLVHKPERILALRVRRGMTVLDVGPGMGFFTIPMARLVGTTGKVIAVDLQERMLKGLLRRARKARMADRIQPILCSAVSLGLESIQGKVDFVLVSAVLHEVPEPVAFLKQLHAVLKPQGTLLLIEPKGHVSDSEFARSVEQAKAVGFRISDRSIIPRSHAMDLIKK